MAKHGPKPKLFEHEGRALTLTQWEDEKGIGRELLRQRMDGGMTFAEAITTPVNGAKSHPKAEPAPRTPEERRAAFVANLLERLTDQQHCLTPEAAALAGWDAGFLAGERA
jgi:hypothetical protein